MDISENNDFDFDLLESCKKFAIKKLNLGSSSTFPGTNLKFFRKLESLYLDYHYDTLKTAHFKSLKKLKTLTVSMPYDDPEAGITQKCYLTKTVWKYLKDSLESLDLIYCWYEFRNFPVEMSMLTSLFLERTDIENYTFRNFPNLKKFVCLADKYDFKVDMRLNDGCFQYIPNLKELRLQNTKFGNKGFTNLRCLEKLTLEFNDFIDNSVFNYLLQRSKKSIRYLSFDSRDIGS